VYTRKVIRAHAFHTRNTHTLREKQRLRKKKEETRTEVIMRKDTTKITLWLLWDPIFILSSASRANIVHL
jgi:hypothetical protein